MNNTCHTRVARGSDSPKYNKNTSRSRSTAKLKTSEGRSVRLNHPRTPATPPRGRLDLDQPVAVIIDHWSWLVRCYTLRPACSRQLRETSTKHHETFPSRVCHLFPSPFQKKEIFRSRERKDVSCSMKESNSSLIHSYYCRGSLHWWKFPPLVDEKQEKRSAAREVAAPEFALPIHAAVESQERRKNNSYPRCDFSILLQRDERKISLSSN